MTTVNTKRTEARNKDAKISHVNHMNGQSFDITNPIYNLRLAAASCFFGEPMYYHAEVEPSKKKNAKVSTSQFYKSLTPMLGEAMPSKWIGMTPSEMIESAIDAALDYNIEATLKEASRLRNEEFIRTTPQVILVRAANHKNSKGTGLIRQYAKEIILRADEPSVCVAYQFQKFGKKMPSSLKRALADKLSSFNEYSLAKYRMESRVVKTVDVVNLVHPSPTEALNKLVKGTLSIAGKTWEAITSEKGSSKEVWEECIPLMGHDALLKNLRNFIQSGVDYSKYVSRLIAGVDKGMLLPFRYYAAHIELSKLDKVPGPVADAVEKCLMLSMKNAPHFEGRTMSLCDNSGSARGGSISKMSNMSVHHVGNLTGVITGMLSDDGYVGVFGDSLEIMPIRKASSIFDQVDKVDKAGDKVGQGTENGIWMFWRDAIQKKEHWDNVFIYSDMQAGHGGLYGINPGEYSDYIWNGSGYGRQFIHVPKLIQAYRNKVNPNVNVYLVQIAGYQDTLVPEYYKRTYIMGGWGPGILKFAKFLSNGNQ